jgi:hypothetical protein
MKHMNVALSIALTFATLAGGPDAGSEAAPDAGPRTELTTISGTLAEVAYGEHRLTVATEQGATALAFDRNTAVYLPRHMGTPRDLAPGQPVRAAFGAGGRVYWIEVRSDEETVPPAAAEAPPSSGPAILAPPATPAARPSRTGAASASPDGGAPPGAGGGAVPAGPSEPEPNPGARPNPPAPPALCGATHSPTAT